MSGLTPPSACTGRGLKDMELDTSSIEKRFAFGFLQQLLRWMDISQEFIAHLGTEFHLGTQSMHSPFLPWPDHSARHCSRR